MVHNNCVQFIETKILSAFFTDINLPLHIQEIICTVNVLISHALEIHQNIDLPDAKVDKDRYRQLSVLAGDYASSRYYQLLAKNNLITEIKLFASAIQVVNEAKMSRHFTTLNALNYDVLIGWMKTIYTTIGKTIIDKYNNSDVNWNSIHENIMMSYAITSEFNKPITTFQAGVVLSNIIRKETYINKELTDDILLQELIDDKFKIVKNELNNINNIDSKNIVIEVMELIQSNVNEKNKELAR